MTESNMCDNVTINMFEWDDHDIVLPALGGEAEVDLCLTPASPQLNYGRSLPGNKRPRLSGAENTSKNCDLSPQKRQRIVIARSDRRVRARVQSEEEEDASNVEFIPVEPEPALPGTQRTANPDDSYVDFADSVLAGAVGFFQISKTLFVVQGWDKRTRGGTVGHEL